MVAKYNTDGNIIADEEVEATATGFKFVEKSPIFITRSELRRIAFVCGVINHLLLDKFLWQSSARHMCSELMEWAETKLKEAGE